MTNLSSSTKKSVCRRSLLKSVPAIAGAIIATNAMAESLFVQAKLTHEAAKYQDQPKDGQQCSSCVQFVAPASCKVSGGSDKCEWVVPTLHRQARLRIGLNEQMGVKRCRLRDFQVDWLIQDGSAGERLAAVAPNRS